MKFPIADIKRDKSIWPRQHVGKGNGLDKAQVERYVAAIANGDKLPPITLEKGTNRLLDGFHRLAAAEKAGLDKIDVEWDNVPADEPAVYHAAVLNARHGSPLDTAALTTAAQIMAKQHAKDGDANALEVRIARNLSWAHQRVSEAISLILGAHDLERDIAMHDEEEAGDTQETIARRHKVTRQRVQQILAEPKPVAVLDITLDQYQGLSLARLSGEKANNADSGIICNVLSRLLKATTPAALAAAEGARLKTPPEFFERLYLSMLNENKPDLEKMNALFAKMRVDGKKQEFAVHPYDVWNIVACDNRFGTDGFPGRIPAELIANAVYFFTEPGDLVLDPMAGGGTTGDVCLALNRRCVEYDIAPIPNRPEIIKADVSHELPPANGRKAALLFWDPPYFNKKVYAEGGISHLPQNEYLKVFTAMAEAAKKWLAKDGVVAFLMSNYVGKGSVFEKGKVGDTNIWNRDYIARFEKAGYEVVVEIQCPLSTQQTMPYQHAEYARHKNIAIISRTLTIMRLKERP